VWAMGRFRQREGATAVEFAIVLPILLMLLFGIISMGLIYNQQLTLTQAAREGARFAATHPVDGDYFTNVEGRVIQASGGTVSAADITVCEPNGDGQVSVVVERPARLEIIVNTWDLTVTGRSIARHEAETGGGGCQ
jgi:Flp pilus assembly protein TadG